MMGGTLLALQIISTILVTIEQSTGTIDRINKRLKSAHEEGREVTVEELTKVIAESKALEKDTLAKLQAIIQENTS